MRHRRSPFVFSLALLACCATVQAIEVETLDGFEDHFGRYAPGGDCARQPQIVVDRTGFAFEGGPALPKATRPEYAASYGGNYYEGIALWFFPYTTEPRPYLLTINADDTPGRLTLEGFEFDYPGGPKLPAQYKPYLAGSPYARCK